LPLPGGRSTGSSNQSSVLKSRHPAA